MTASIVVPAGTPVPVTLNPTSAAVEFACTESNRSTPDDDASSTERAMAFRRDRLTVEEHLDDVVVRAVHELYDDLQGVGRPAEAGGELRLVEAVPGPTPVVEIAAGAQRGTSW
jgi:hypothetical protein